MIDNLTETNFFNFAMASYTNIHCHGIEEFYDDLLLIKYIKRLFKKYCEIGEIDQTRLRLALNHLTIFYNVFEMESATRILFFRFKPELYPILKTFLVYLNYQPSIIHGINGKDILASKIKTINTILERLKSL
jgi:hypothetical protein